MVLDIINKEETIRVLEEFMEKIRPPKEIRDQLDIAYKIWNLFRVKFAYIILATYFCRTFQRIVEKSHQKRWKIGLVVLLVRLSRLSSGRPRDAESLTHKELKITYWSGSSVG